MKREFLLDENILIRPIEAGDTPSGLAAARLWSALAKNCHRILVSPTLFRKYRDHLRLRREKIPKAIPTFPSIVWKLINHKGKSKWISEESPVSEEQYIRDPDDHFLIRIAVRAPNCIFVSTDETTRQGFNREEISGKYNIQALTIEEALRIAQTEK